LPNQGYGAGPQAGGGIAISGLPAHRARLNATYAPTGGLIQGYPSYAAGPTRHLYRHPEEGQWHLHDRPFDPAKTSCRAHIPAAAGPVPTGARAWTVDDGAGWVEHEVTACEVDAAAAAAAALEAECAAAALAQGKRVVRPPSRPSAARTISSALHRCRPHALLGPAPNPMPLL
jgi:hypothetical protein